MMLHFLKSAGPTPAEVPIPKMPIDFVLSASSSFYFLAAPGLARPTKKRQNQNGREQRNVLNEIQATQKSALCCS